MTPSTSPLVTSRETSTFRFTNTESNPATSVTIDCNSPFDEVLTPGTVITSPNYPNSYANNLDCEMTIRFSESTKVLIEFDPTFEIEYISHGCNGVYCNGCSYDYLEVYDGPSTDSPLGGSRICGSSAPAPIQSTGNSMKLIFHTDSSETKTGFKITASAGKF